MTLLIRSDWVDSRSCGLFAGRAHLSVRDGLSFFFLSAGEK